MLLTRPGDTIRMPGEYKRLGDILVESGVVSNLQLAVAVAAQRTSSRRLGEIIVERGYATEEQIAQCLAEQYGYPFVEKPESVPVEPEALELVDAETALTADILPFRVEGGTLHCLIWDPIDIRVTDALRMQTKKALSLHIAPRTRLAKAIRAAFGIGVQQRASAQPSRVPLPERFQVIEAIDEETRQAWLRAYDTELDRTVQISAVHTEDHTLTKFKERVKEFGAANHPSVAKVFDFFQHEEWNIAVLEDNPGETLLSILRTRGSRNPAQTAIVCAQVAEACDAVIAHGKEPFLSPRNVLVHDRDVVLAPTFAPPVGWIVRGSSFTDCVLRANGLLIATCLTAPSNWELADFDQTQMRAAPKKLHDIYLRCIDRSRPDRFVEPVQIAAELKAYRWSGSHGVVQGSSARGEDRDALLTSLDGGDDARPSFWQRLFGRAS
ncbi:MAG: hypothetical protein D6724_08470 [Armatimonadetes bacterium]|nr:MAG: hypothetical protein D6724_08470 [Armatimonadota bacterium]